MVIGVKQSLSCEKQAAAAVLLVFFIFLQMSVSAYMATGSFTASLLDATALEFQRTNLKCHSVHLSSIFFPLIVSP